MEKNIQPTSGGTPAASGVDATGNEVDLTPQPAASGAQPVVDPTPEPKNDLASKLKREKDNWRAKAAELEAKLEAKEKADLEASQKYKELYELEKDKRALVQKEKEELQSTVQNAQVNSKLRDELTKLGLRTDRLDAAFKLIDKNSVQLDPETGVVVGAEDAAKRFHEQYHDLGLFSKRQVGVDQSAPNLQPNANKSVSDMTMEEKLKLLADSTKR